MSLFGLFGKKDKQKLHTFTDEEREKASNTKLLNSIKRQKLEIQRQELEHYKELLEEKRMRQEMDNIKEQLYSEEYDDEDLPDEDSPEDLFTGVLTQVLTAIASKYAPQPQIRDNSIQSPPTDTLSVDEDYIKQSVDKIPQQYLEQTRNLSDEQLSKMIIERYPQMSDGAVLKTVQIIRTKANAK